tara:strand:- start:787 stop:1140 length:354 start_codon:yes stop_codon:yes gene_type:complete
MTVMPQQLTQIIMPMKIGMETPEFLTEVQFKEQGYTDLVNISSILSDEEIQYVSSVGSRLGMIYIENSMSKMLVPMKTIMEDGVREMKVPRGFTARTATVNGQRGLVGFPAISGGSL